MEKDKILARLEKELNDAYEFNTAQFDYRPNPSGKGMIAHNPDWGKSEGRKQNRKKIDHLIMLIGRRKKHLKRMERD